MKLCRSIQLLYEHVKVIVPSFSSHETYEVYVLGVEFSNKLGVTDFLRAHKNDQSLYTGSCLNISIFIIKTEKF
jgi:hypothetical protein